MHMIWRLHGGGAQYHGTIHTTQYTTQNTQYTHKQKNKLFVAGREGRLPPPPAQQNKARLFLVGMASDLRSACLDQGLPAKPWPGSGWSVSTLMVDPGPGLVPLKYIQTLEATTAADLA